MVGDFSVGKREKTMRNVQKSLRSRVLNNKEKRPLFSESYDKNVNLGLLVVGGFGILLMVFGIFVF